MNVLMFGWEFPPLISGGLGTACYGLIKSLSKEGVRVTLVLPRNPGSSESFLKILFTDVKIRKIDSILSPYLNPSSYSQKFARCRNKIYSPEIFEEVQRYTEASREIIINERFDVIHCHDWLTYPAGIMAKNLSKKPLIVHVHATEFDRTGGNNLNQRIYDIERAGMHTADVVIAVSNFTKDKIVKHYGVAPEKVKVVHNGIEFAGSSNCETFRIKEQNKVVLFLGRITIQKGPDYFLYAAKRILEHEPNVKFIIAGSGDMEPFLIEKAAEMDISDSVLFAGFLSGADVERAYRMADLYIMPSVSEPFGLTPLEAMKAKTPVMISNQSGVSEVVNHCLKVDFWDINEIANKAIGVLRNAELGDCLRDNASKEIQGFSWAKPAKECLSIYNALRGCA